MFLPFWLTEENKTNKLCLTNLKSIQIGFVDYCFPTQKRFAVPCNILTLFQNNKTCLFIKTNYFQAEMSSTGNHFGVTGNILGCDTKIVFALTLAMKVITSKMRL